MKSLEFGIIYFFLYPCTFDNCCTSFPSALVLCVYCALVWVLQVFFLHLHLRLIQVTRAKLYPIRAELQLLSFAQSWQEDSTQHDHHLLPLKMLLALSALLYCNPLYLSIFQVYQVCFKPKFTMSPLSYHFYFYM